MNQSEYDAVVVGAGPNGLSAAIELARAGLRICLIEAKETVGGGARSAELTELGFIHDVCSTIHPMGFASPFFRSLNLERWGVEWVHAEAALAHPFDDGTAALLFESLDATCETLGRDAAAYRDLMKPLADHADELFEDILRPVRLPRHPLVMLRFGLSAVCSCVGLANLRFQGEKAKALLAGCAAHQVVPLDRLGTASFGLVLMLVAHKSGWPFAGGGSQKIADALAECLKSYGGEIRLNSPIRSMRDLPRSRAVLFDLTPRQIVEIAGDELPPSYRSRLSRFRYGPGVFKVDWALNGPIPWRASECTRAATVHVGGSINEIAASEDEAWNGKISDRPFVIVAQQSLFDSSRAPAGKHTAWAYCHVPHSSSADMTERIENQIERFAPGFREIIIARHTMNASELQHHNENFIGGDIGGGANNLRQFIARPVMKLDPYSTPNEKIFICSSSTPPGGGVHGMCGYNAARSALRRLV
ncbi:MAG TPA: NAD(P)/FAD-dependent oxidoreductase [Blastocatellia bacterium]|nr:NAD(P)/FAD-dependent oxidoreductase [Blastocatellia bacterium]